MYGCAILSTLGAWVLGLVLDANIGFSPLGFLELRILLPVLAMGSTCSTESIGTANGLKYAVT